MGDGTQTTTCTAFSGHTRIASGSLREVAEAAKRALDASPEAPLLAFDDETGEPLELDLRGTVADVLARLPAPPAPTPERRPGPGRPRLGVESREVSLLPRHWEWLAGQPGGASAALRRLVEAARKRSEGPDRARRAQEAAHRFMWAMAGDLPGFEEASRAFYARDYARMRELSAAWPPDLRDHAWAMVDRLAALEAAVAPDPKSA